MPGLGEDVAAGERKVRPAPSLVVNFEDQAPLC